MFIFVETMDFDRQDVLHTLHPLTKDTSTQSPHPYKMLVSVVPKLCSLRHYETCRFV